MKTLYRYIMASVLILALAAVAHAQSIGGSGTNVKDYENTDVTLGNANSATESSQGSAIAYGGNATSVVLSSDQSTRKWAGYYGNATGTMLLGDGSSNLFNFGAATVNLVMATTNSNVGAFSAPSNQTNIGGAVYPLIDWAFFNLSDDQDTDPTDDTDSALAVYTSGSSCKGDIGGVAGVDCVQLRNSSGVPGFFKTYVMQVGGANINSSNIAYDDHTHLIYVAPVASSAIEDFKGGNSQFEMMLPVAQNANGLVSATTTYYFYLDIE